MNDDMISSLKLMPQTVDEVADHGIRYEIVQKLNIDGDVEQQQNEHDTEE